jgi:hypothetical protein
MCSEFINICQTICLTMAFGFIHCKHVELFYCCTANHAKHSLKTYSIKYSPDRKMFQIDAVESSKFSRPMLCHRELIFLCNCTVNTFYSSLVTLARSKVFHGDLNRPADGHLLTVAPCSILALCQRFIKNILPLSPALTVRWPTAKILHNATTQNTII